METIKILRQLLKDRKINQQQFRTYKGQVVSGNEDGCIKGLLRKELITQKEADRLVTAYQLEYTE